MLLLGCYLAEKVLSVELRKKVEEEIEGEPLVKIVGDEVRRTLDKDIDEKYTELTYWGKVKYNWKTKDRFMDWFCHSIQPLFKPTHSDWEWLSLPVSLSWLHYLLRPFRLMMKYIIKMFE